jgi:hypothetical protein
MSPIGSLTIERAPIIPNLLQIGPAARELPTRLGNAGEVPFQCLAAEANPAQAKAADITTRPAADLAAIAHAVRIFAM